jgi:preprotein translocase subunit YajC
MRGSSALALRSAQSADRSEIPTVAHTATIADTQPGSPNVLISEAYAQTAPAAASGGVESSLFSMLPLVLMFVVLWFIMIKPQMKKQKEHKAMIESLAKGDEVVVGGGVIGKVSKMGETFLHVEVASGVELQVQRGAVVQVLPKGTFK